MYHPIPLNQILYGPPGTGKTYACVDHALAIFAEAGLGEIGSTRAEQKQCFDQLVQDGHIRFVTFHQSFSYEDFIESIRPRTNEDGSLSYCVEDGLFKRLCACARSHLSRPFRSFRERPSRRVWKMSLNTTRLHLLEDCFTNSCLSIPYEANVLPERQSAEQKLALLFQEAMDINDIVLLSSENKNIQAIAEISGSCRINEEEGLYQRSVHWLCRFTPGYPAEELLGMPLAKKTLYAFPQELHSYPQLLRLLHGNLHDHLPYVLIIDEINRGNVSRIFGELITLIEESRREGNSARAKETLSVRLPYSRELFTVPANVYLIATMNSADRSLTRLDSALRRRFDFIEMPPRPDLLQDYRLTPFSLSLADILTSINQRLELLLDRDHCLGHAFFMTLPMPFTVDELSRLFKAKILPLLQEYFLDDWQKIAYVLNDHNKAESYRFVIAKEHAEAPFPFSSFLQTEQEKLWTWNESAFTQLSSYAQIVDGYKDEYDD